MSDDTKRIIDQEADTSLSAGDYVMVDSQAEGTRKFDLGTELSDIKEDLAALEGGGLSDDAKAALLACFRHIAFLDDDDDYYQDLYDALYNIVVTNISLNTNSLSFGALNSTQQLTATTIPAGGAVTWASSDTSVATVSSSGLVTSVGYGSSTITATAGSVSATCSVVVAQATLSSISALYTQSGAVYDTDDLDDLKDDLVVTATWSDSSTSMVASTDYTLTGTLTVGTSTITVAYGGKTTTFTVTVSETPRNYTHVWDFTQSLEDTVGDSDATINNATRDSSGLHLSAANAVCFLGANVYPPGSVVEVDFASTSANLGTSHGRLMMINDIANPAIDSAAVSTGFIYRNTGAWSFYRGGWSADSSETNANVFSGKTLKMVYYQSDADNKFYTDVYVDNTLVASNGGHINEWNVYDSPLYIGSAGNSYHDAVITGVRIYPIEE